MTAIFRVALLSLVAFASGCNLANTADLPTQPAAVTPDAVVSTELAAEPTPADFAVDEADLTTAATPAQVTVEVTGDADNTVVAGEFRLTVTGDVEITFDSAGTSASAELVDQGATALLRFRLGEDASSLFAQEIGIMVPADIQPGEFLLRGNFGLGELTGDDADSELPMEGRVTIDRVDADSISGSFQFTAMTGAVPTVVTATFNRIPRVTE